MENCCIIYFGGAKICDVTNLEGTIALLCSLAQKVVAIFCEQFDNQHCNIVVQKNIWFDSKNRSLTGTFVAMEISGACLIFLFIYE
jgi:hypothetical protein